MRWTRHFPWILTALLAAPPASFASTPYGGPRPWDSEEESTQASHVTRTARCLIERIGEQRSVVLYDLDTEKRHGLRLTPKVDFSARYKKMFDGRRKIDFADLRPGHLVRLTFRAADGVILRVKVVGRQTVPVADPGT